MQRKKNIILLSIFLVLLAWTIIFMNRDYKHEAIALDENIFAAEDTASIIKISIKGKEMANILAMEDGRWMVNSKFPLDPSMQKVLMSVLKQVRVKRTVPKNDLKRIREDIREHGFDVKIEHSDGMTEQFHAGGNGISLSYFMGEDSIPYIMQLPGYESYVTGIFEVRENDWRDRLIFQTSWLGLKSMELSYPGKPSDDLRIIAEKNLYRVSGVEALDTLALMSYLDDISYFFADQFIDHGQIPAYDSLKTSKPFAELSVNSLGLKEPLTIRFFQQLPGEQVVLGILNDGQMCLFSTRRIGHLFKTKDDFTTL